MSSENLSVSVNEMFEAYDNQIHEDVSAFNLLLNTITTAEERKKDLWKKIYYNSLIDRRNAFMMYADLVKQVEKDPTQHAVLGTHISKYLERMSKANDQLIKLAEIVDSKVTGIIEVATTNENILDTIQSSADSKKKPK